MTFCGAVVSDIFKLKSIEMCHHTLHDEHHLGSIVSIGVLNLAFIVPEVLKLGLAYSQGAVKNNL